MEHPQTNGQGEAANKMILRELRKKVGSAKGLWVEEILGILWGCHCTPQSTTGETPFRLTYEADAMIQVEVGEASWRRENFGEEHNSDNLRVDLDLLHEIREDAW